MGIDKVYHIIAGAIISTICICFVHATAAIGITATVGAAKEVYDYYYNGTVEAMDVVATIVGGSIPIIIVGVMQWL